MTKEDRYFGAVLEELNSKFDLLIELVQHVNTTKANQSDVMRIEKRIKSLQNSTTATLNVHATRIRALEIPV